MVLSPSAAPQEIDRKAGGHQSEAREAVARVVGDLIDDNRQAHAGKDERRDRKACRSERGSVGRLAAQPHHAERKRAEEDPFRVDDA